MHGYRSLNGAFLVFWGICALLATLAFWTQVRLGTVRMAAMTEPQLLDILRMQVSPWIAAAILTPLVILWSTRVWNTWWIGAAAHLAGVCAYLPAFTVLSLNVGLVLRDRSPAWPTTEVLASRGAGSLVLGVTKYAVIVGATMAFRYYREARERASVAERLARTQAELERDLASARLLVLRQHLQPHFLFNALNAVSGLTEHDPAAARRVLARIGDLLRLALERRDAVSATLGEELDFADRYLAVEQARLGDRLRVAYDVPAPLLNVSLPSFALQPLVENAVRHGIARLVSGGTIEIGARRADPGIEIWVRNDTPPNASMSPEGIGLGALRARLTGLYGDAARLDVRHERGQMFLVTLAVPAERSS